MLLDIFSSLDYYSSNFSFLNVIGFSWFFIFVLYIVFLFNYFFFQWSPLVEVFFRNAWIAKLSGKLGVFVVVVNIFSFIFFQNVLGLFPYTFSSTSHLFTNFIIAFEVWLGIVLFGLSLHYIKFLSHFTPLGGPLVLANSLNFIEWVSLIIRSLTLSLRLAVNISTGHIFLGLVSVLLLVLGCSSGSVVGFVCFVGYFFFEIFVCFIQAFVFGLLLVQYIDEAN
uniref:ATP synthase subunit a n=1 Tax=Diversibipalium mayottensis TaxID=3348909 RepID=A0A8K1X761_9PLAT|nr:ATP synthase F0 subunit 6 [Diversibipalium sp. MNHN JL281]